MSLHFNFYGIHVTVAAPEHYFQEVLNFLREDFEYFVVIDKSVFPPEQVKIELKIEKTRSNWDFKANGNPLFKTKMCQVYGLGRKRLCDYGNGTIVQSVTVNSRRRFVVTGSNSDEVYEVSYLALLSAVGEELDLLGYHRIHALGVTFQEQSLLALAPSGGGKSAKATVLLQHEGISIYSDEMPLVKQGKLYPFPIRIALEPGLDKVLSFGRPSAASRRVFKRKIFPAKVLTPISNHRISVPNQLSVLLLVRRGNGLSKVDSANPVVLGFNLFLSLVIGLGLCQMSEHMLRANNIVRLFRIGFSRFREAMRLFVQTKKGFVYLSQDVYQNAKMLISTLER